LKDDDPSDNATGFYRSSVDRSYSDSEENSRESDSGAGFFQTQISRLRDEIHDGEAVDKAVHEVGETLASEREEVCVAEGDDWQYRCGKPNFVLSRRDTPSNEWRSFVGKKMIRTACHPFVPTAIGLEWVDLLIDGAEKADADDVRCYMHIDVPNIDRNLHNILRVNPDFRSGHGSQRKPWFDWVTVQWSDLESVARLCLFGEISSSQHDDENAGSREMLVVAQPLLVERGGHMTRYHLLPFLDAGRISDSAICFSINNISSIAYVLPTSQARPMRRRTSDGGDEDSDDLVAFPVNPDEHKYFVVIPPRYEWDQHGWSDSEGDEDDD
ncbi:MAG: hypothetical protein ACREOZ_00970, partial [Gloeomargaritales cyanobacterium]